MSRKEFTVRVFIVVVAAALVAMTWLLSDVLLLVFGAALLALGLRLLSRPLVTRLGLANGPALAIAITFLLGAMAGVTLLLGPTFSQELSGLAERLPAAYSKFAQRFELGSFGELIANSGAVSSIGSLASRLFAWGSTIIGVIASAAILVVGGIYLAADPDLYLKGAIKLFPAALRPQLELSARESGTALQRWLVAQLIAMAIVGVATALGLFIVGVPSAIALGLIAGVAEFIPLIGPFVALLPILIMAASQDLQTLTGAFVVFILIQQVESNVMAPLIAKKAVAIAPALGLFAVVAMGIIFGPLGLLLGYPLVIVADTFVRRLYVLDTLGTSVDILGTKREADIPARTPSA
jgi:predicted PurR-regulated permease PerM